MLLYEESREVATNIAVGPSRYQPNVSPAPRHDGGIDSTLASETFLASFKPPSTGPEPVL